MDDLRKFGWSRIDTPWPAALSFELRRRRRRLRFGGCHTACHDVVKPFCNSGREIYQTLTKSV